MHRIIQFWKTQSIQYWKAIHAILKHPDLDEIIHPVLEVDTHDIKSSIVGGYKSSYFGRYGISSIFGLFRTSNIGSFVTSQSLYREKLSQIIQNWKVCLQQCRNIIFWKLWRHHKTSIFGSIAPRLGNNPSTLRLLEVRIEVRIVTAMKKKTKLLQIMNKRWEPSKSSIVDLPFFSLVHLNVRQCAKIYIYCLEMDGWYINIG